MRNLRTVVVAALALLLLGCDTADRQASPADDGPLEMLVSDGGGVSILRPDRAGDTWSGSFGSIPVCLEEAVDGEVVVEEFRVLGKQGTVEDFEAFVAAPHRRPNGRPVAVYASTVGRAPDFPEPYTTFPSARKHSYTPAAGATLTSGCDDKPMMGIQSLVITFDTDDRGGGVSAWELDYRVGDEMYTTGPVKWELWLCPPRRTPDIEMC